LDRILTATGLGGIRTIAFSVQNTREGVLGQVFVGLPEASRQGIFKILGGESREFAPPAFVPADAVKFQRWRLDLQKTWAVLDKAFRDLSPDSANGLNFILDMANTAARDKDPGFDIRKNLIGNLGDEIITYQKAPRGTTAEQLNSPPSLFLIGSPQAEQLVSALKSIFTFLNSEGGPPAEREFLGRKIFSLPKPTLPFMPAENTRAAPATLSYAASGGYIAFSTDLSMLEEFLRSNARDLKALRATPGLLEASQAVTGSGTGFLAFENQGETMRARFEQLRRGSAITNSVPAFNPMTAALGISLPELNFKQWVDFSLLPPFEKVARYFHFTVYGGSANMDGLSLKMFTPAPPGLNREK
jgi:hypothetical protein